MHVLALAVPLLLLAPGPPSPQEADRRPDRSFLTLGAGTLGISGLLGELRVARTFGTFGLELGGSALIPPFLQMADLSALAQMDGGGPVLLRAGVTAYRVAFEDSGSGLGYHAGVSYLGGTRGRIRLRVDVTFRVFPDVGAVASVGIGIAVPVGARAAMSRTAGFRTVR